MKSRRKSRVRRKKELSTEQILTHALKLLAIKGWEGATYSAIAKASDMSISNIAYHFNSREVLLHALLEKISQSNTEKVVAAMLPEFDAYQRIKTYIEKNLEWASERPESAQVLVHIYVSASHDSDFAKTYDAMIRRAHNKIRELVLAGIREKLFLETLDVDIVTRCIHDLVVGAFIKVMATNLTTPIQYKTADWDLVLVPLLGVSKN